MLNKNITEIVEHCAHLAVNHMEEEIEWEGTTADSGYLRHAILDADYSMFETCETSFSLLVADKICDEFIKRIDQFFIPRYTDKDSAVLCGGHIVSPQDRLDIAKAIVEYSASQEKSCNKCKHEITAEYKECIRCSRACHDYYEK